MTIFGTGTLIVAAGGLVAAGLLVFYTVPRVREWVRDSETILLNRLTMFAGLLLGAAEVLSGVDPHLITPFVDDKWVPVVLFGWGALGELMRRFRAEDL